jgi:hypothetical protein
MNKTKSEIKTEATTVRTEEKPVVETESKETTSLVSNAEVNEYNFFDAIGKSPLNPKDPDDGWYYYWASTDESFAGITKLKMRGYEIVRVGSEGEIPTYGGERRPDGSVVYGNLILMKRPKELHEKDMEAKRRQYKRLANQKIEEAEEQMQKEGAEHQPNRRTFYFAENPLAK